MTYTTIAPGSTSEVPFVPAKGRPSLEEMQAIVGGYIELVRITGGEMWVNEDGRSKGLAYNRMASGLAGQDILGTVLVCRRARRVKS